MALLTYKEFAKVLRAARLPEKATLKEIGLEWSEYKSQHGLIRRSPTSRECTAKYIAMCKNRSPSRLCRVNTKRRSCYLPENVNILVSQPRKTRSPSKRKQIRRKSESAVDTMGESESELMNRMLKFTDNKIRLLVESLDYDTLRQLEYFIGKQTDRNTDKVTASAHMQMDFIDFARAQNKANKDKYILPSAMYKKFLKTLL